MSDNLLVNPGFEGPAHSQDGIGEIQVVDGWRAFWKDAQPIMPDWAISGGDPRTIKRPEWKPLPKEVDAARVHTGVQSQCLFSYSGILLAGVQQTVDVDVGDWVQGSIYAQSWSSEENDPNVNYKGDMYVAVGIDPMGGDNPWARRVLWSDWRFAPPRGASVRWARAVSPVVQAINGTVTMFVLGDGRWATRHNDLYLDSAELYLVDLGGPIEPPPPPPPPPGDDPVDYERITRIVADVLAEWDRR